EPEPAVAADLDERDARAIELQDQRARVGAVEQAEAIESRLDLVIRPRATVDDDRVADELRPPDRRHRRVGTERAGVAVVERARARVPERAVLSEGLVLDDEWNLVVANAFGIAEARRGAGQRQHLL